MFREFFHYELRNVSMGQAFGHTLRTPFPVALSYLNVDPTRTSLVSSIPL